MTHDLKDMVAIAASTKQTVTRWAQQLQRAAIAYHIATATRGGNSVGRSNAELWVAEADAEEARHVIRSAAVPGLPQLW